MNKFKSVRINLINNKAKKVFSESLINYCDKKLFSLNPQFYNEVGNSVLINCSEILQSNGGEFFDNCVAKITEGGRYEQKYIIHLVCTKDKNELSKMYYSVFELMIKYDIKFVNLELFQLEKISKFDSLEGLFKAIKKYNQYYQKKIVINLCEEDNTYFYQINRFLNKKNNIFNKILEAFSF